MVVVVQRQALDGSLEHEFVDEGVSGLALVWQSSSIMIALLAPRRAMKGFALPITCSKPWRTR